MLKKYVFSIVSAVVLASSANAVVDAQSYSDEQIQAKVELSQKQERGVVEKADPLLLLNALKNFSVGDKKSRAANYDQSSLEVLNGTWNISFSIGSTAFTDTLTLGAPTWVDDSNGYGVWGKDKYNRSIGCFIASYKNYKYQCIGVTALGDSSMNWYVFNKNGDSLSGGFYIGNPTDAVNNFVFTPTRYPLSGTRYSSTTPVNTTTTTTTTSAPPPPPGVSSSTYASCDDETISRIIKKDAWHLLGATSDGCTVDGIKSKGATAVFPYDTTAGAYSSSQSIPKGQGFWIKK